MHVTAHILRWDDYREDSKEAKSKLQVECLGIEIGRDGSLIAKIVLGPSNKRTYLDVILEPSDVFPRLLNVANSMAEFAASTVIFSGPRGVEVEKVAEKFCLDYPLPWSSPNNLLRALVRTGREAEAAVVRREKTQGSQ